MAPTDPPTDPRETIAQALAGFFDPAWYLASYPDVSALGGDALQHYIAYGAAEGRNPNAWFEGVWYQAHYPAVAASGLNPLLHYLKVGAAALLNPHPRFDAAWYVREHPEAAANPLLHHLLVGAALGWATEPPVAIEDYLPSSNPRLSPPPDVAVDVIILGHATPDQTRRCILSVLADPAHPPGRIIVVDDRSAEPGLSAWLDTLAAERRIERLRTRKNRRLIASANRGIAAAGTHDLVLLDSAIEVPAGWLGRLAAQAYAAPRIATVSPFCNNATICGYPSKGGGSLPPAVALTELDAICQEVNAGRSVELPSTAAFCMYIRRAALIECGGFDEAGFGGSPGWEADFCRRAVGRGWRHLLACDTFVAHTGNDIQPTSEALREAGEGLLETRFPDYRLLLARHVVSDMADPFRFALTAGVFRHSGKPSILLVSHGLGGGVRRHFMSLVDRFGAQANFLLLAATNRGVALSAPALPNHPLLTVASGQLDELVRMLKTCRVTRVHVHHMQSLDIDIRALIHRLNVPFDVTVHDYFAICPQMNLLPWPDLPYCGEPGPAACNACIANRPANRAIDILSWRRERAWQFLEAERVFCPSADVQNRLARHGLDSRTLLVPHEPVAGGPWQIRPTALRGRNLRIAILGVLANLKGGQTVAAVAELAAVAGLEIHLIGPLDGDFPETSRQLIRATGEYEEAELPLLLRNLRPHLVWFPSPCPETYSYTLTTAIEAGLPIVATRIGSFPERLAGRPLTWLVDTPLPPAAWLEVFAQVRTALRRVRQEEPGSERPSVADYYSANYLIPAPRRKRPAATDLRRPGRTSVVIIPERSDNDALSVPAYIRLLQPLDHLSQIVPLDLVLADAQTALNYQADLIVTQGHAVTDPSQVAALAQHTRATGAKLVYDLDEDLLHVPRRQADPSERRRHIGAVQQMLRHADRVFVSTEALASRISGCRTDAVRVMPTALDERLWCNKPRPLPSHAGTVRILCLGADLRDKDLALIIPALERIKREYTGRVSIDFVGLTTTDELPASMRRVVMPMAASTSYPGLVNWLIDQPSWDIGLAPLADTTANRCKPATKALDYAALRMAIVASDMPGYRGSLADGPGGMLVKPDPRAWYAAINRLVRNPTVRRAYAAGAAERFAYTGTLGSQAQERRAAWEAIAPAAPGKPETKARNPLRGRQLPHPVGLAP
jgi:glycosyltransferase involved in cell wall biosynthesis/GT2 family glycosyltransferase